MLTIKREESVEPLIASIASVVSSSSVCTSETDRRRSMGDVRVVKPSTPFLLPPPEPYGVAKQTLLAPSAYYGSSPRTYRLVGSSRVDVTPAIFSRLPSRLDSAIATAPVDKTTATTTTHSTTSNLPKLDRLAPKLTLKSDATKKLRGKMDEIDLYNGDEHKDSSDFTGLPSMIMTEQDDESVFVSRVELADLQHHVELLQNAHAASEETVRYQGGLIMELVMFNQRIHDTIEDLHARVGSVESVNNSSFHQEPYFGLTSTSAGQPTSRYRGGSDGRSRSPSPDRRGYRDRGTPGGFKKARKNLQISIPGKIYAPPTAGLPTPMLSSTTTTLATRTPKTPLTPGRFGPPTGTKKSATCINKRGIHNLDKMVPPTYSQLPLLPLTDTEIIVYFFNSLSRPIVSLRLYAREWGPAAICDTLNSHRTVEPAYLRNTCSVKCTTAIKKGKQKYGDDWDTVNRTIFANKATTDDKATDMIRLAHDEVPHAEDFDIRDLCNGLQKHPGEGDGGIFTRCVKYCQENNAAYNLSDVWELASDLDAGRTPRYSKTFQQGFKTEYDSTSGAASECSDKSVIGKDTEPSSQE